MSINEDDWNITDIDDIIKTDNNCNLNELKLKKFKNGVVIKLEINKSNIKISYNADSYCKIVSCSYYQYDIDSDDNRYNCFSSNLNTPDDLKNILDTLQINNMNLYIIRHFEASHNVRNLGLPTGSRITKKKDTNVIIEKPLLKKQLDNVYDNLKNIDNIDYVFVSDLIRTRETYNIIAKNSAVTPYLEESYSNISDNKNYNDNIKNKLKIDEIITLPNIHELNYNSIKCSQSDPSVYENISELYDKYDEINTNNPGYYNSSYRNDSINNNIKYLIKNYKNNNDSRKNTDSNILNEVLKYLYYIKNNKNNLNIIVVTHSRTIRCFLTQLIKNNLSYYVNNSYNSSYKSKKLKNKKNKKYKSKKLKYKKNKKYKSKKLKYKKNKKRTIKKL